MAEHNRKLNTDADARSRKTLVAAVATVLFVAVVMLLILFFRNPLFTAVSRTLAADSKYETAEFFVELCNSDEADVLNRYIDLRQEINENYALMVNEFDRGKITAWRKTASEVCADSTALGEKLFAEAAALSSKLDEICGLLEKYDSLRPEIMELFDVFNEINRLYTKDATGGNTVFTISQEYAAIDRWEWVAAKLHAFSLGLGNGEKTYLFTYFIKEAQGEAVDLRSAMNSLVENGYSYDVPMRVTGDMNKTFPSIRNGSGAVVNLQQKDTYEQYMYKDLCGVLAEMLGGFYVA